MLEPFDSCQKTTPDEPFEPRDELRDEPRVRVYIQRLAASLIASLWARARV